MTNRRLEPSLFVLIATSLLVAGAAAAETRYFEASSQRGYSFEGPYAQLGVSIGVIEVDFPRTDVDAGGGFTLTGGYRFLPWLSAEANFSYVGGGDLEFRRREIGDAEYFSFTFGPKSYPFGAVPESDQPIPGFIQPYALLQIGGGEVELDPDRGGTTERSAFIARFLFGVDLWMTDRVGAFIEGGYHLAADDDIDGTGLFTFGGQYRF